MFLYWINTNRMGTAKNDFCNVFILKKHSLKKQIYTCELVRNFKKGKTNVSMHVSIQWQFTWLSWKKNSTKNRYNTKNMQHFLQPRFLGNRVQKYLLTAFLNLPVEEEVSISRQNTVHTTSTMSANQAEFQQKKECHSNAVNAWNTVHGHQPSFSWQTSVYC